MEINVHLAPFFCHAITFVTYVTPFETPPVLACGIYNGKQIRYQIGNVVKLLSFHNIQFVH
jgi:hypothetical protein